MLVIVINPFIRLNMSEKEKQDQNMKQESYKKDIPDISYYE